MWHRRLPFTVLVTLTLVNRYLLRLPLTPPPRPLPPPPRPLPSPAPLACACLCTSVASGRSSLLTSSAAAVPPPASAPPPPPSSKTFGGSQFRALNASHTLVVMLAKSAGVVKSEVALPPPSSQHAVQHRKKRYRPQAVCSSCTCSHATPFGAVRGASADALRWCSLRRSVAGCPCWRQRTRRESIRSAQTAAGTPSLQTAVMRVSGRCLRENNRA